MECQQILDIIMVSLASIVFIVMIIHFILDIKASNKYWESMYAELELFKTSLHKEHDLLKKVQEYGEWLDTYNEIMHTNAELEEDNFNLGVMHAAEDVQENFLKFLGEYVDGEESSD